MTQFGTILSDAGPPVPRPFGKVAIQPPVVGCRSPSVHRWQ